MACKSLLYSKILYNVCSKNLDVYSAILACDIYSKILMYSRKNLDVFSNIQDYSNIHHKNTEYISRFFNIHQNFSNIHQIFSNIHQIFSNIHQDFR